MSGALNDVWAYMLSLVRGMGDGTRAFITQPYTEVNSKTGTQWEGSLYTSSLAQGAQLKVALQTGSNPIAIKGIRSSFSNSQITTQLFKSPTGVTGGQAVPKYNLNDALAQLGEFTVTAGVATTANGIAVGPSSVSLGSTGVGSSSISALTIDNGVERILAPNSMYLYLITNTGNEATPISSSTTWYEGGLDYGEY